MREILIFFYILLLNGVVGSVLFLLWKRWKEKWFQIGQYRFLYQTLKGIVLLFLLPLSWCYLWMHSYNWDGTWTGRFPWNTGSLELVAAIIFCAWLPGVCVKWQSQRKEKTMLRHLMEDGELAQDIEVQQLVREIAERVHLKGTVKVFQGKNILSPITVGAVRKQIWIPKRTYEKKELAIILEHELVHIKYRDVLFRRLCLWIQTAYWFLPPIQQLLKEMTEWGELHCDFQVCKGKHAVWSTKEYYGNILKSVCYQQEQYAAGGAYLYGEKEGLQKRILQMKEYEKMKYVKKGSGMILAAVFVLMCPMTVFAASQSMGEVYEMLARETEIAEEYTVVESQEEYGEPSRDIEEIQEEYCESDNTYVEIVSIDTTRTKGNISGDIKAGGILKTEKISLKKGNKVTMYLTITPDSYSARVGLMKGTSKKYVTLKNGEEYTFTIEEDGNYSFYAENTNKKKISVEVENFYR